MLTVVLLDVLLDVCRLEILRVLDVVESLAQGLETVGVVSKLRSVSSIDDVPCIHNGIGYFFPVVPTVVVVVAVWLRARSLICLWLATSGTMTTCSFLILLVSSVLLFLLLLTLVASGGTACLRYCYCGSP